LAEMRDTRIQISFRSKISSAILAKIEGEKHHLLNCHFEWSKLFRPQSFRMKVFGRNFFGRNEKKYKNGPLVYIDPYNSYVIGRYQQSGSSDSTGIIRTLRRYTFFRIPSSKIVHLAISCLEIFRKIGKLCIRQFLIRKKRRAA
jgi:hypothetical protein